METIYHTFTTMLVTALWENEAQPLRLLHCSHHAAHRTPTLERVAEAPQDTRP